MNIKILVSILLLVISQEPGSAQSSSPNFILILTDDHGWTSTSTAMDQKVPNSKSDYFETPGIDRLASQGMRFSHGYAPAALCTPTRRSILYGQTAIRQGTEESFPAKYHPDQHDFITIPLMLKKTNPAYKAAHFGKFHLQGNFFPEEIGYDESDGDTNNSGGNMFEYKEDKWMKTFFSGDPKKADHITGRGINFIKRCVEDGNPFYLQLSHYATHVDIQSKADTYKKYSSKPRGTVHDHPGYAGMLDHMDASIGRVLDFVEAQGISGNTYIILLADNGGVEFIPPSSDKMNHPDQNPRKQRNYPLRGGKWVLYEGGIRVPFIIKGPGVKPGSQCDVAVTGYDLLPTLADLVGYGEQMPAYIDGGSLKPLLEKGDGEVSRAEDALFFHRYAGSYPHSAVIQDGYKLIKLWRSKNQTESIELYSLKNDLGELYNLASEMPEKAAKMEQLLMEYMRKVNPELVQDLMVKLN